MRKEELLAFRVNTQEKKMIERAARRNKMDVSDYVRSCVYFDLVMEGDVEALKLTAAGVRRAVATRLKQLMGSPRKPQEET